MVDYLFCCVVSSQALAMRIQREEVVRERERSEDRSDHSGVMNVLCTRPCMYTSFTISSVALSEL